MKKLLALIVLTAILAAGLTYTAILYAASGDLEITIRIPAWQVADFRAGFLAKLPNNVMVDDPASTPENPLPQIQRYTDKQHIRRWTRREWKKIYRQGKELLSKRAAVIDPNMLPEEGTQ